MSKAAKLRELLSNKKVVRLMGAHNAVGAKLAEEAGFEGIWASGFEISSSHGLPDANILTMREFLDAAIQMNNGTNIPIVADCDQGFGNSNNVIHMVQQYEAAGIAAVCIEDKKFPKVNSYIPGRQELAPIAEFVGKILAAKNAQRSKEFMVFARVEAFIAGWGLTEAVKRANAYAEAGADAILMHSKSKQPDEIRAFIKEFKHDIPIIVVPTTYPTYTQQEMEADGVSMCVYANQGMRAAILHQRKILQKIAKEGIANLSDDDIVPMKYMFYLQGMDRMKQDEAKYHITEDEKIRAIIPAAGAHVNLKGLASLLQDRPLAMLDINGKSILERAVDNLHEANVHDISVIAGYKKEMIYNVKDIDVIENDNYAKTSMVDSLLLAEDTEADKSIIIFSDLVFEKGIVKRLIEADHDIVIVMDRHPRFDKETATFLTVDNPTKKSGSNVVRTTDYKKILKYGKEMRPHEVHCESVGMSLFSKKGLHEFKEAHKKLGANVPFSQIIQHLIDQGKDVYGLEIHTGWLEIENFDDYKEATQVIE